jgi:colanic acid biosynthesis glycosyl transferase WcaI
MRFLVYGINYKPELTGIGKYTGEMSEWLAQHGHDVRVLTAPPYYPAWQIEKGYKNQYTVDVDSGVKVYRCPLYVPNEPTTLTRLLHLISFAFSSFFVLLRLLFWRPQVVFVVEPTLFCTPMALLYARLTRAKIVLHIQDFEIDAMFGLGLMSHGVLGRIAKACEKWLMRRFDAVSTISSSMMNLAQAKGVSKDKIVFFPNWVDTDFVSPAADYQFFRRKWQIADDTLVVLYSGNMGKKQGLELVLEAAEQFKDNKNVLFLMVGQGAAFADLQATAQAKLLLNVRFEPLQPYDELPMLLAMADIHLVVQKMGAADVVLPSKLTGILSVGGHALITAEPTTELGLLIKRFPNIAQQVDPENLSAFVATLAQMLNTDTKAINTVARQYAEDFLNQNAILKRFEQELEGLVAKNIC